MLDYAANAVSYWNLDSLREGYEESRRAVGEDPENEIAALTEDPEADYGEYWERAKTNLLADVFASCSLQTWYPPSFNASSSSSTNACPRPR